MKRAPIRCQLGKLGYATKRDAELANPECKVERCGRCRQWHPVVKRGRRK